MSRNGTLEDALKSISDFNKHHREEQDKRSHDRRTSSNPAEKKPRVASRGQELEASEDNSSDAEGRKQREKKSSMDKDQLKKKKKRHGKKRRKRDSSEDDEDETSRDEGKVRSRAIRKKSKDKEVEGESEGDSDEERKERRERRRRRKERERLERRERKERRRQRRKRHESSSESEEEEDALGTGGRTSPQGEANGVDALTAAQIVLDTYAELRSELVQLLSTLDEGQAVDISSLPDARLKSLLENLFTALSLRRSPLGLYLLPEKAPKTLQTLAPVLHPSVTSKPEPNGVGPSAVASYDQDAEKPLDQPDGPSVSHQKVDLEDKDSKSGAPVIGPALPPGKAQPPENGFSKRADTSQPVVGPDLPNGLSEPAPGQEELAKKVEIGPAGPPPTMKKRVIGPAAPPPEVLEAAAKLTEAEEELRSAYEEDDVLIGPPPPAMIAEADNAPDKERFDEVAHILAPTSRDPYTILRVKPDSSASEIKKRYWKVSLLVHPDKCAHPQAQQAFTVLNKAFKEVEDPTKRAIVDAKLEEIQRKAEFAEELKGLREAAQWRKLRGESQPGDEELLGAAPEEEARDTWMTELPPERQAGTAMPMQSTYFSTKERTGRGDTSAWTDNPQEKAKKAQQQYLEAYSQAMLGPATDQAQAAEKASATAQIIDDYNSKKRSQTLVEKHQEALQRERKKKKKKTGEAKEKEEWEGSHPWKPWDREKDLAIGKTVKLDKDSSVAALASRFGPGRPGERRFL